MGGGLAFLTKKSFNPANWSNQRQVWEARQKNETEKRRLAERQAQLKREREEEDLARVVGGEEEGGRKALGFMYDAGKVPGLERKTNRGDDDDDDDAEIAGIVGGGGKKKEEGGESSLFERQAGDDDAAAAFRAMLAQGAAPPPPPNEGSASGAQHEMTAGEAALSENPNGDDDNANPDGKDDKNESRERDHRTNLEKAVGRGINNASGVTLAQQMERFPMLKGAPMVLQKPDGGGGEKKEGEASGANVIGLNFKPLGQVLRNVQCLKCGKWGHARGDRECEVSGWNPFAASAPPVAVAPAVAAVSKNMDATVCLPAVAKTSGIGKNNNNDVLPQKTKDRKHEKEKKRHKEDRHRKKRRKHGKRRRRSPSYSSSDSESSFSSYDDRDRRHHRGGHRRDEDSDDDSSRSERRHRSRKDGSRRHRSSSRRHEKSSRGHRRDRSRRSRSRSRSPLSE